MSHFINYQYVHFIWSTRDLTPIITKDSQSQLLAFLSGILKKSGGIMIVSSVTSNHIHLLANISTDIPIAELLRQIKHSSSKWYHKKGIEYADFGWNEGYAAFTVSPASVEKVKQYLAVEAHRHSSVSFEDELRGFLTLHEIDFKLNFLTTTTYTKLIYHLVWSVKNRESIIDNSLRASLHEHMKKEVEKHRCKLHAIGSVSDHIHLLIEGSSSLIMSDLVQNLKTTTTHCVKKQGSKYETFYWQEGYGVFSVGKPAFEIVKNYVNDQEQHHRTKTLDQEWAWLRNTR